MAVLHNTIVKKLIPNWTNALHVVQLELVSAILDGKDVIYLIYPR